MGAPSVPPGRYFRMHLVGYFEGIDSERGLEWRCSDSLSLREFLLLEMRTGAGPFLSRTRARLPHEVHTAVFDWVLALIAEAGLVKPGSASGWMFDHGGQRGAAQHRADTGEGYRRGCWSAWPSAGIETPTAEDLARWTASARARSSRTRTGYSRSDPEAKIAKMKDGTTHLAYKPEHAVDRHRRGGGGTRSCTQPTRAIRQRFPRPWRRPRQTSRRWMWRRRPKIRPNV